eukprot:TRINITY_DN20987_c0_g1_i1.p1 TRINITY_DN20987_c0_g1~~TRINITY_DN20987_c0_g1_i1.p1  ORF type:complete len:534 (+),score=193.02 TRINITY_DN20987_c0_g1_i1:49-1602(+)
MVKRIVRKKKAAAPKGGAAAVLDLDEDDVGIEPQVVAAVGGEDDVVVAERLRLEAMEQGGRSHKAIARFCSFGEPIKFGVARGAPTCCIVTEDGEWLWYGDKNGNVFRCSVTHKSEWVQMSRHKGHVLSMAVTKVEMQSGGVNARGARSSTQLADAKVPHMLATGGSDGIIKIFNADEGTELHELQGHRGPVTGLAFRLGKNVLYSGSGDRTLKVWAAEDAVLLDTFYGHIGKVTSVAAGWKEEAVTTGDDRTVRLFKVEKGTQSAYAERQGAIECASVVSDNFFITGAADGTVALYNTMRRRPLGIAFDAHGKGWHGDGDGLEQVMTHDDIEANTGGAQSRPGHSNWVTSTAAVPYSDLVASGGIGGAVHIYQLAEKGDHPTDFVQEDTQPGNPHSIVRLQTLQVPGIVNSLFFNRRGSHLACTVSREQRLGRWLTDRAATNQIFLYPITLCEEPVKRTAVESADAAPSPTPNAAPAAAAKKLVTKAVAAVSGAGGKKKRIVRRVVQKRKRQIILK